MKAVGCILIIMTCLLCSCLEDTTRTPNFVVEGFIVAGEPVNNIKIKQISSLLSEEVTSESITDARVVIEHGSDAFPLLFNSTTGLYEYVESDLNIEIAEEYRLTVDVGDRLASATTLVPDRPTGLSLTGNQLVIPTLRLSFQLRQEITDLFQEERITLTWDEVEGQSFFVVIENRVAELDPILPEQIPEEAIELLSSFRFISEPSTTGSFDIIGVALETYGPHVAKVFTVNEEYVDLFNSLEQDSRDLNEPPSNVSQALGIFTAFAVDSLEFEVVRE
ncbi:MAG: DUF4249 family protein [Cytophagales bacterium]|nr:DUF4249 family protein [Cytophagales bacterium]